MTNREYYIVISRQNQVAHLQLSACLVNDPQVLNDPRTSEQVERNVYLGHTGVVEQTVTV